MIGIKNRYPSCHQGKGQLKTRVLFFLKTSLTCYCSRHSLFYSYIPVHAEEDFGSYLSAGAVHTLEIRGAVVELSQCGRHFGILCITRLHEETFERSSTGRRFDSQRHPVTDIQRQNTGHRASPPANLSQCSVTLPPLQLPLAHLHRPVALSLSPH